MEISRKLYERPEEGLSVRDDYSGRCMYGRTCFGIVVDNIATAIYDLANILQSIIDEDPESDLADDAEALKFIFTNCPVQVSEEFDDLRTTKGDKPVTLKYITSLETVR